MAATPQDLDRDLVDSGGVHGDQMAGIRQIMRHGQRLRLRRCLSTALPLSFITVERLSTARPDTWCTRSWPQTRSAGTTRRAPGRRRRSGSDALHALQLGHVADPYTPPRPALSLLHLP